MSLAKFTYSVADDFGGVLTVGLLSEAIAATSASPGSYVNVAGDVCEVWIDATQAEIDALVASHPLRAAKAAKFSAIDRRTGQLISAGFAFAGRQFSLSTEAQSRLMGLNQIREDPNVVYPVKWNTIDDAGTYILANATDVINFYLTAIGTYRYHLDKGTALKDQVRAAATVAEVDAVTDTR